MSELIREDQPHDASAPFRFVAREALGIVINAAQAVEDRSGAARQ